MQSVGGHCVHTQVSLITDSSPMPGLLYPHPLHLSKWVHKEQRPSEGTLESSQTPLRIPPNKGKNCLKRSNMHLTFLPTSPST